MTVTCFDCKKVYNKNIFCCPNCGCPTSQSLNVDEIKSDTVPMLVTSKSGAKANGKTAAFSAGTLTQSGLISVPVNSSENKMSDEDRKKRLAEWAKYRKKLGILTAIFGVLSTVSYVIFMPFGSLVFIPWVFLGIGFGIGMFLIKKPK